MMWLAYIGPGERPSGPTNALEWAMIAALGALVLRWWVLLGHEPRKSEWRCLGLALLAGIGVGISSHACLSSPALARHWSEWQVLLLALVLLASAFAALGAALLGLGRWIYGCEVPAALARAPQRPWPPGAR